MGQILLCDASHRPHLRRCGLQADRGTVFLECYYQPFKAAGNAAAVPAPGAKNANMSLGISKKKLTAQHKGVLTVTLIKCIDLDVSVMPIKAVL